MRLRNSVVFFLVFLIFVFDIGFAQAQTWKDRAAKTTEAAKKIAEEAAIAAKEAEIAKATKEKAERARRKLEKLQRNIRKKIENTEQLAIISGRYYADELDRANQVASSSSPYGRRLKRLTDRFSNEDDLNLNFKVYITPETNAFALADGSIRLYSGLMDEFSDEQLMFVLGHEIGHVKHKHIFKEIIAGYTVDTLKEWALTHQEKLREIIGSEVVKNAGKVVIGIFDQTQELDSDRYSLQFMKKYGFDLSNAISVLEEFKKNSGKYTFTSTHPSDDFRIEQLKLFILKSSHLENPTIPF